MTILKIRHAGINHAPERQLSKDLIIGAIFGLTLKYLSDSVFCCRHISPVYKPALIP